MVIVYPAIKKIGKMRHFSYLRAIFLSFFSKDLYVDVVRNWKGSGFAYVLTLLLVMSLPFSYLAYKEVKNFDAIKIVKYASLVLYNDPNLTFEQKLNKTLNVLSQFPSIRLKNGTIEFNENHRKKEEEVSHPNMKAVAKPYKISDPISQFDLIVFDLSGQIYESIADTTAFILVTKDKVFVRKEDGGENIYDLSIIKNEDQLEDEINEALNFLSQIPLITIEDGLAATDVEQPYVIKDLKGDKELAIIDTSGKYNNIDRIDAIILLNRTSVIYKNSKTEKTEEILLTQLNAESMDSLIDNLSTMINILVIPTTVVLVTIMFFFLSFCSLVLAMVFYGIIGMVINNIVNKHNLEFSSLMRISAVALTPVLILRLALPDMIAHQEFIYFLISIGYLFYAIKANVENV